jgi:hypothetical protein
MIRLDTADLALVGRSKDTNYYLIEENILGAVPDAGTRDDAVSAQANVDYLNGYFREHGPGVVLVFFDMLVSQDRAGRTTYQSQLDPELLLGAGLIGGNMLARALAAAFLGLGRAKVPFKVFPSLETGLAWAREKKAARL